MPNTAGIEKTQLAPYFYFYGRCEEALEFYRSVFGGSYEVVMRNSETSFAEHMPPDFQNKISHSQFNGPGFVFMASDGPESRPLNPDEGNVSLSLAMPDPKDAARVFEALSEGGHVRVPLEDASWAGKLGVLQDRFATEWIITTV